MVAGCGCIGGWIETCGRCYGEHACAAEDHQYQDDAGVWWRRCVDCQKATEAGEITGGTL